MAASPVKPVAGLTSTIVTGGQAVVAVPAGAQGGFIVNPANPVDQGLANSEPIFIDPTGADAVLEANGTCFRIDPGQSWEIIPGQTTTTSVNAASGGHKFSVVYTQDAS